MAWQLVMIAWGTKYDANDINGLLHAVQAKSSGLARAVLISDRPRQGLDPVIVLRDFPTNFIDPVLTNSGCQAKLAMFAKGVLTPDMPALYLDLDTLIFDDVSKLLTSCKSDEEIAILQSAILPFGPIGRLAYRLSKKRRYARGNSSAVVFHPAHCHFIAEEFQRLYSMGQGFVIRPMIADERFISWVAQPRMRAIPTSLMVKFPTEFMYPWLWLGYLRAALPWVRRRRAGLVAITLPGLEVKPDDLLHLKEGALVIDAKGRKMRWEERYLGASLARLKAALSL